MELCICDLSCRMDAGIGSARAVDLHRLSCDPGHYASAIGQRLLKQGKNIKIELDDSTHDYIQVCYDESLMIRQSEITKPGKRQRQNLRQGTA